MLDYYVLHTHSNNNHNSYNNNDSNNNNSMVHVGTPSRDSRHTSMVTFHTDESPSALGPRLALGLSPESGLVDRSGGEGLSAQGPGLDEIERMCQEGDIFDHVGRCVLRANFDPMKALQWTLHPPEPIITPSPLQPHTRFLLANNNDTTNNNDDGTDLNPPMLPHISYITRDEYGLLSPLNYAPSHCHASVFIETIDPHACQCDPHILVPSLPPPLPAYHYDIIWPTPRFVEYGTPVGSRQCDAECVPMLPGTQHIHSLCPNTCPHSAITLILTSPQHTLTSPQL